MIVKIIDSDICGGEPVIDWFICDTEDKRLVEEIINDANDIVFHYDNQFNKHYGEGFSEFMNLITNALKSKGILCNWFNADLEIGI